MRQRMVIQSAGLNLKAKYTALELMAIVEHMERQATELRWCNSDQQLADGLTKASAQDRLRKFLMMGQLWSLAYDESFTSAKKKRKLDQLRETEEEFSDACWIDFLQSQGVPATVPGVCKKSR